MKSKPIWKTKSSLIVSEVNELASDNWLRDSLIFAKVHKE
jgi:hypothetical protein